jgi:hypothetical protein
VRLKRSISIFLIISKISFLGVRKLP